MKTKFFLLIIAVLIFAVAVPMNLWAEESGTQVKKVRIIEPGEVVRCASDFFVENIGKEEADLKVVLGDKVYVNEMLKPGERRAFDLAATINVARHRGREDISQGEVAVIINLGPKAHMRVRCMDLRDNPLKNKDPLADFK